MKSTRTIGAIAESSGTTKAGKPYKRWAIDFTDGFKLSTFDEKLAKDFKIGQCVDIETEQKGQFQELKSMVIASNQVNITESQASSSDREKSIIAQTLVKATAEIMAVNKEFITKPVEEQLLEAYKYFRANL